MSPATAERTNPRPLVLLVAVVAAVAAAWSLSAALDVALRQPQATDYLAFATGGRILNSGSTCLYCPDVQRDAQVAILGHAPVDTTGFPNYFANPPAAALLMRPLAALGLATGLRVFLLVSLAAVALGVALLLHLVPRDRRPTVLLVSVATIASLPAATSLRLGQWNPLLLLALAAALVALRRGHGVLAGLLLATLLVKPQLLWLVVPMLLVARAWRPLAGVLAGAAVVGVSGLALLGPAHLTGWWTILTTSHVSGGDATIGLPGLVATITGRGGGTTFVTAALLAAACVMAALRWRDRLAADPATAVALGVVLSLLCAPHVFPDDVLLLAAPLGLLAVRAPAPALLLALALSPAWLADTQLPVGLALRHAETLVLLGVAAATAVLGRRSGTAGARHAPAVPVREAVA